MTDQSQRTRTCTACGQKKPLIAFLELAGPNGHSYGSVCAHCRQTGAAQKPGIEADTADTSGGTTRHQLDHKMRKATEQEKAAQFKLRTEIEGEEKAKKDTETKEDSSEKELREETEKKHREEYLDTKKQESGSSAKNKAARQGTTSFQDRQKVFQTFAQEKSWADRTNTIETAQNLESDNLKENKKTSTDVSVVAIDAPTATIARSSQIFSGFRQYLGKSAAINRTLSQYSKTFDEPSAKKPASSFLSQPPKEKPVETKAAKTEVVTEFVNNNMKKR